MCLYYFENGALQPTLYINYLAYDETNGYTLNSVFGNIQSVTINIDQEMDNSCDLNDIIRINDNRFAFISTLTNKLYVLVFLFDLYADDQNLIIRIYLFHFDGYTIYSNLRLFLFKDFIGFNYCYGTKENCAFKILNYANTTDYEIIDDFLLKLDAVNPLDLKTNIAIENNIFEYELTGIKIISIPNKENTRLSILRIKDLNEIKKNDILKSSLIIFTYIGNETITNGDYIIEFAPIVSENSDKFNSNANVYHWGENNILVLNL